MDGKMFDEFTRAASGISRRRALGLLGGAALTAGVARFDFAGAKKGKGKKKRCRKSFQACNGKKKCCKGLSCVDGTCGCPANTIPSAGKCINPDPAECAINNDCGINETCQSGVCVPNNFECAGDDDCDNGELCVNGECVPAPPECDSDSDCGALEVCQNGECVFEPQCELDIDCPPNAFCVGGICFNQP